VHGKRLRKEELNFIRKLDAVIPITTADEALMRIDVPDAWYEIIPAGVDIDYYTPSAMASDPATILWVGGMNWEPNKDAVYYFANEIFPLIRKVNPTARFEIVGAGTDKLTDLKQRFADAIVLHGQVPDVRPDVERATVMVCPLRVGGGMRLKLLDFFAKGKAVVSTSIGAEGNSARDNEHILLRDAPKEFSDAVLQLIALPDERSRVGVNARRLVEAEYSWESVGRRFIELYKKVIGHHRGNR
jgi:polysaccharide biosynthesis protein PslH